VTRADLQLAPGAVLPFDIPYESNTIWAHFKKRNLDGYARLGWAPT